MKIRFSLAIVGVALFGLQQLTRAQCPQSCDDSLSNTALGSGALVNNTTGISDTAIGFEALFSNTTGGSNTATGSQALISNTTGQANTATGDTALLANTTGLDNTATGAGALAFNTTGYQNTATGFAALLNNTTGINNTATGYSALGGNTTGDGNTANGYQALGSNTTGINNTANGHAALRSNTTGNNNIAVGYRSGLNLTTGGNNIDIGNAGVAGDNNKIRIGTTGTQTATFIAGISGVTVPAGVGVIVGTDGKLGTVVSSERFKDKVQPMDKASEAILALKPVTFLYKKQLDPDGLPQFGLVAEQVEKVNPHLVARDDHGKPYTVRYEAVNAMLLNEFLKEHRKVETLEARMVQQEKDSQANASHQQREIDSLKAALKEQAPQIQKVMAQLPASPRLVADNQ